MSQVSDTPPPTYTHTHTETHIHSEGVFQGLDHHEHYLWVDWYFSLGVLCCHAVHTGECSIEMSKAVEKRGRCRLNVLHPFCVCVSLRILLLNTQAPVHHERTLHTSARTPWTHPSHKHPYAMNTPFTHPPVFQFLFSGGLWFFCYKTFTGCLEQQQIQYPI